MGCVAAGWAVAFVQWRWSSGSFCHCPDALTQLCCEAFAPGLEIGGATPHRWAMKQIGWSILGTGVIAHTFAAALTQASDARLVSVMSRDAGTAAAFAAAARGAGAAAKAMTELKDVLADPDVDIVYIATPNHLHAQQAIACLKAGKAVLCEKPLATHAADARLIAQAAHDNGRFCMEAMWSLCLPAVLKAQEMVAAGRIGTVRNITASLSYGRAYEPENRIFDPALGGGALLDLGVYPLALSLRLLGAPASVSGQIISAPNGSEMQAALVTTHNGALAQIGCGYHATGANDMVITGETGIMRLQAPLNAPALVSVTATRRPDILRASPQPKTSILRPDTASRIPALRRHYPAPYRGNGFIHQIEEAMACMRAGMNQSEKVPLSLSVAVLEVIDTIKAQEARKS
jgi:predicted dehydrogenase